MGPGGAVGAEDRHRPGSEGFELAGRQRSSLRRQVDLSREDCRRRGVARGCEDVDANHPGYGCGGAHVCVGTLSIKTAPKERRSRRRFGPVALTALGALLFLASVGYWTYGAVLA